MRLSQEFGTNGGKLNVYRTYLRRDEIIELENKTFML